MKATKRIAVWLKVIYSLFATIGGVKANILNAEDTVEKLKKGRSLIRFGDGEFGIYRGKDIHYQKWSEELKEEFDKIKKDYEENKENCPYVLAVPKSFMTISGFKLMKKRVYVSSWAESRLQFKKTFNRKIVYGDSFLFEKKNKEIYSKIWDREDCPKNVIFVHNTKEYADNFANTYNKNVFFIACPKKDAFSNVDDLENNILAVIENNGLNNKSVTIAISAGPCGKVLVYRLSKLGYQVIDAGHCWDDPLEGV